MQFLYPHFFWLLLASIIPLIFHLKKRFGRKRQVFPYIFLFESEIRKEARLYKIKEFLLLIIRVLTIITLVMILAYPTSSGRKNLKRHIYVFLDNTHSLLYRQGNSHLLNEMKNQLSAYILSFHRGTTFTFMTADKKIYRNMYSDEAHDLLRKMKTVDANIEPINALELMKKMVKENEENEFALFSDFRENRFRNSTLERNIRLFLIGKLERRNVGIVQVKIFPRIYFLGEKIELEVTIQNYSNISESALLVVSHSGNVIYEKNHNLDKRQQIISRIQVELKKEINDFQIQLTQDNFPYDDAHSIKIKAYKKYHVLLLGKGNIEKQLIAKSLFPQSIFDLQKVHIDYEIKQTKYDLTIILGYQPHVPSGEVSVFFPVTAGDFASVNNLFRRFLDNFKVTEILRDNQNVRNDIHFPPALDLSGVSFKNRYRYDTHARGYFPLGQGYLVYTTGRWMIFSGDIQVNSSNFLFSAKLPVIMNYFIYQLSENKIHVTNNMKYWSNGENDIKTIDKNFSEIKAKNYSVSQNNLYRWLLFIILLLLILSDLMITHRREYVKEG